MPFNVTESRIIFALSGRCAELALSGSVLPLYAAETDGTRYARPYASKLSTPTLAEGAEGETSHETDHVHGRELGAGNGGFFMWG